MHLYSEGFWEYTYSKMQQDISLGRVFDSNLISAVKCMFKSPLSKETKQWLGKVHSILDNLKNI